MNPVSMYSDHAAAVAGATPKLAELRQAAGQLVSMTFLQTLLNSVHDSALKGKYGHGGRGEEIFIRQLNALLSDAVAAAPRFGLVDAVTAQMGRRYAREALAPSAAEVQPAMHCWG